MLWLRHNLLFFSAFFLTSTLMLVQLRDTKITDYRQLTEMEKIDQLRRMNEYPPSAYRLANYIEKRPEAVAFFKLEKNFVGVFDLMTLFTIYFPALLLPFFLLGFFEAVRIFPRQILLLTALPIALMTIIGQENRHRPVSLFPVIIVASISGMMLFINTVARSNEK